jgi:hypothetical protein
METAQLDAAAHFLASHARVLDRRRFERLFEGGGAAPVRDAVAAYRNADGGFGHALEPDGRTPGSQPAAAAVALRTLHEADAWDDGLVGDLCEWLVAHESPEGGTPFVLPTVEGWPHAPWWVAPEGLPAALFPTGQIAGMLHAHAVDHPWLPRASDVVWSRLDGSAGLDAYELRGVVTFLDHVPDRERAEKAFDVLAPQLLDVVTLDPDAPGEVHGPLDFAPLPDSIARRVFDDDTIAAHLDHLAAAQRPDGGWTFNWPAWSPAAEAEWRGSLTVDALVVLRANGR